MTSYRILTPDAQYADDGEVERAAAGDGFVFDIFREREAGRVPAERWSRADGLLVWHEVVIDRELIESLANCRIIVRAGVGFDHIDLAAAGAAGIPVCNTPDYGTSEVADHAIGMLLALRRGLAFYNERLHAAPIDHFYPAGAPMVARIRGSRLGLIGLGRIGTATALRAKAFGIDVLAYDPDLPRGQEIALGVSRTDRLEELLRTADAVSLHTPLNEHTRNIINADTLALMPAHAILINTARGALVDIDALYTALINDQLAGAALDVLPEEPPAADRPLIAAVENNDARLRYRVSTEPARGLVQPRQPV